VQGVFYRDTCRRAAELNRVHGWVRNCEDGDVEAVFEGPADAVEAMLSWCRIGPPRALVTKVTVTEEPPEGERVFRIKPY
jgi:acylphosphatase